jgi:ABC-type nitrate/sulfonate/bicarbonate transport system substrate-binding protein
MIGNAAMQNWAVLALTLALCLWIDSRRSVFAQASPKLRPLRIALPSHSVSSSPVYIAKSLGIFERSGFDTQILVLEPRAALAALLRATWTFTRPRERPGERRYAAWLCES